MYLSPSKLTLSHRPVQEADLPVICLFPQNEQELYFMFPAAEFPLTVDQLIIHMERRWDSTVVLFDGKVAGFANFYLCQPGETCSIGNVIVSPDIRGQGVGRYLINTMIQIAATKHNVKNVQLTCFNQNINGLLLYQGMGFKPVFIEERRDKQGNRIAAIHFVFNIVPE